jgi:hypothetical protein
MEEGEIEIDSIEPLVFPDITPETWVQAELFDCASFWMTS